MSTPIPTRIELPPGAERPPGTTRTMVQRVAERLRDMIAQQSLAPGARLRERDLAQHLSVSRTPLREAIRILTAEGLVEFTANRGAVVADPSGGEIHDLMLMLGALEALGGEQAATRATDAEIAEVRSMHEEMIAAYERGDRMTYYKRNQEIHCAIVAASKNVALIEMHARTNARLYRIRFASHGGEERWQGAVDTHEEILAALAARDGDLLARTLREHLRQALRNIQAQESVDS